MPRTSADPLETGRVGAQKQGSDSGNDQPE